MDSQRFEATGETRQAARKHGSERRQQGYNTRMLVLEAHILHNVVSKTLHEHMLSIDVSTFISELMHVIVFIEALQPSRPDPTIDRRSQLVWGRRYLHSLGESPLT